MEESKKSNFLNNISGIMIFLLVLCQFFLSKKIDYIAKIIYIFVYPVLAFATGYISKSKSSTIKENLFKILFYYLVGNTIVMWLSFIVYKEPFNLTKSYYIFWYLLAIFVWKLLISNIHFGKISLLFSIFVGLMIGFFYNINDVFAVSKIICFFPFFLLGYNLKDEYINKFLDKRNIICLILGVALILFTLFGTSIFISNITIDDTMMMPFTINKGVFYRGIIYGIAFLMILGIMLITSDKKIPFITLWGENYIYIFLYHGIVTFLVSKYLSIYDLHFYIILFLILTFITCLTFGNNKVAKFTNMIYEKLIDTFKNRKITIKTAIIAGSIVLLFGYTISFPFIELVEDKFNIFKTADNNSTIYNIMNEEEEEKVKDSVSILFTGDLILLKEQVERAYNKEIDDYDFNSVFDYTKEYIQSADLSVGVFEGPMAGSEKGYTSSDYGDGTSLHCNFPDEFGQAIKNAGFDLLTIANNHIFDKGEDGAYLTAEALNNLGLETTGVYRNINDNVKVIEKEGLKIGVLSYTYGFNYYSENESMKQKITPTLVDRSSKYFKQVKQEVEKDFAELKEKNVDTIIVLPHMGTSFSNDTDSFQDTWNNIFIENGADVIVGDHVHTIQPIEFRKNKDGKDVVIANCLGNFINSYTDYNGDATAMFEVYIDKNNGSLVGGSLVPMWTTSPSNGNYQAVPIYDIVTNEDLKSQISTYELKKVEEIYALETKVMINQEMTLDLAERKLYLSKEGYKRKQVEALELIEKEKSTSLYQKINKAKTVCFIGDSITEGTKNGGYSWYEPLINNFNNKKVINISKGGGTVSDITKIYNKEEADLYIIAIGTNDIRYRNGSTSAKNYEEYIKNIENLIEKIPNYKNKDIVFIAPWISLDKDPFIKDIEKKNTLFTEYSKALENFCNDNTYLYINPNEQIKQTLTKELSSKYLIDHIHPNSHNGIYLYSKAVLDASS